MRRFLTILTILCAVLITGCGNKQIDFVLQQADSLMCSNPDRSYTLLKSIDQDDLWGREQKARFALLYTQAQHKNFDSIYSDSLINIAVKYYEGRNLPLYTLALMYKGAALADMGLKREAMEWYKQAEKVCHTNEYLTLGLINSRMGELYQEMYVVNDEDIEKFKISLNYYRKIKDSARMSFCMERIGQLYILNNIDTAYYYLKEAYKTTNDPYSQEYHQVLLSKAYYIDKEYTKSRDIALSLIKSSQDLSILNEAYISALKAYANLGNVDSAQYYFNAFNKKDSLDYYMCLTEIERARENYKKAFEYSERANIIADTIYEKAQNLDLYRLEKRLDNRQTETRNKELVSQNTINRYIITICILCLILISILSYLIIRRKTLLNNSHLTLIEQLQKESRQSNNTLLSMLDNESKLKLALENQIAQIKQLIELSYRFTGNPDIFATKFKERVSINKLSEGMWKDLRYVVNEKHNGIIDSIKKTYPLLNEQDLNFICLMCCNFSYIEMTVCLGFKNEKSTCNKRLSLARKMGINISLESFINQKIERQ